MVIFKLQVL